MSEFCECVCEECPNAGEVKALQAENEQLQAKVKALEAQLLKAAEQHYCSQCGRIIDTKREGESHSRKYIKVCECSDEYWSDAMGCSFCGTTNSKREGDDE